jgi:hypothetical protein
LATAHPGDTEIQIASTNLTNASRSALGILRKESRETWASPPCQRIASVTLRARLLDIANKCPVHRTLNSETWIPTRLAG